MPEIDESLIESGDVPLGISNEDSIGGGFQSGSHHGDGSGELLGLFFEGILGLQKFRFGPLAGGENALLVLKRYGT